jgi:beta-N-acetylhexosaminidase
VSGAASADPALARLADALLIPPFPGSAAPAWVLAALGGGLAGVTIFGPNIAGAGQLRELIAELRSASVEPVIAIDEEGGDVTRIAHLSGSPYPGNTALGAVDDVALTEAVYRALGADLAGLGVNLNLAPAVDVNTAADNPVIGTRSFGADTDLVARHAAAAVTGLQAAGVAACAKHFPGHGSTSNDSHDVIAAVEGSFAEVIARDLPPFAAAIAAGVRAVMPGHLRVPGLTGDLPASLSGVAQTGLLRGELGFTGVIVSDALEMRAVSGPYGIAEAGVLAVAAGTDLLCFGRDQDERTYLEVRDALVAAVRSGRLPASRLEESAARVGELRRWTLDARQGMASAAAAPTGADVGMVAARRAIRVEGQIRPLADPLLVEIVPPSNIAVGTVPWGLSNFVGAGSVRRISTSGDGNGSADADSVLADAAERPLLVVVRDAHRYPFAQEVVRKLLSMRPDTVIVEMGLPVWHPPAQVYLVTFGATSASSRAAAGLLGLPAQPHE